jgi:hypothetical protein
MYPAPPAVAGAENPEIYSNGMAYYNAQSQYHHVAAASQMLHRRPKAAIPIVAPSDGGGGGGGGTGYGQPLSNDRDSSL